MRKRIISSILIGMAVSIQAQNVPATPKLVVGLTIDQFRVDYMEAYSSLYGDRGFKRLLKEGRFYRNAEYDFVNVDKSSAVASLYTGTTPYENGIIGDAWIHRNSLRPISCVEDGNFMGIYTSEYTSPVNLKVSNLADELAIFTNGNAEIYSIAPTREMAIMAAGHAGKGAFWINDDTGKWCGSTYYGLFPNWVSDFNDREGIDFRIDKLVWTPIVSVDFFHSQGNVVKETPFKYSFVSERKMKFRRLKTSPFANDEVNKLVNQCLARTIIGQDGVPDLLALSYYAGNYDHKPVSLFPLEMQDTYIRLDNQIADLLDMIDRKIGLVNTLFVITSTGYSDPQGADDLKHRVPGGEFHMNRCVALLNLYLGAIYGEGQYVESYYGQDIYLNHKLLEQKQMNLTEVMSKSSEFLVQFSGVKDVYSSQRLQLGSWTPQLEKIKNRYNVACSGDLWVEVLPGWTMIREHQLDSYVVRNAYASAPLVFMGWATKPEIINTPVKINSVAPTLAHFMRIRAPNAAMQAPLWDIKK